MTKCTIEFWPTKIYDFETDLPVEVIEANPMFAVSELICEMGEWPGGFEYMAHGIRGCVWVRKIEAGDGTIIYDAEQRP